MAEVEVLKSPNDKRIYKRVVLSNGLRCVLIHDPEIYSSPSSTDGKSDGEMSEDTENNDGSIKVKKAAASLAVGVGSFLDPEPLQGLAHYLEHMLFMGSKKFPVENAYDDYLSLNGGSSNAYTTHEYTVYMFDVKPSALYGALDRFAQFFIAPLCLENSMDREVMAVDSEYSLSLQDDGYRLLRLMEFTAKQGHAYNCFTVGNRKSLKDDPTEKGINIRESLFEFYKKNYSAEKMCLAVIGGESLTDLESWITELFSPIASNQGPKSSSNLQEYPFEGQYLYLMKSVKQLHEVVVTFQLPSLLSEYRKKSEHYLSHLIGHEGKGSLLSELKRRGWATELCAGVEESPFNANYCVYLFQVTITLTESGLHEGPGFGLAPVGLLFEYLALLKTTGPLNWIYEEMKTTHETKLKFLEEQDPFDYVSKLSCQMLFYKAGDEAISDYLYTGLDSNKILELLELMHPKAEGLRIDLQTKDYELMIDKLKSTQEQFKRLEKCWEPWYGFQFMKCELSENQLDSLKPSSPSSNLALPEPNPYIPQTFQILCEEDNQGQKQDSLIIPDRLLDEEGLRIWHKVDCLHKTPKTFASFVLSGPTGKDSKLPVWKATPKTAACHEILVNILEDVLTEECYMAELANLNYNISQEAHTIEVKFSGFSEKLPLLVQKVFHTLSTLQVDEKVFQNMHEALVKKLRNENMKVSKHPNYLRVYTLTPSQWHVDEILNELLSLTPLDVQTHLALVLKQLHVEALVYGNLRSSETIELCKKVRGILGTGILKVEEIKLPQCLKLQGPSHLLKVPTKNPKEENSGIQVYIQCEVNEITARCKLDFIDQIMCEPCFDQLRTHEQLGYLVRSQVRLTQEILGFSITVVSERFAPNHVNARIHAFLEQIIKTLDEMSTEEFEHHREALIEMKLQKDKNIGETSSILWSHIISRRYDFDSKEKESQIIRKLTKQDLMEYYKIFLAPESTSRRQFLVNVVSPKHEDENQKLVGSNVEEISDLVGFRKRMDVYEEASKLVV